MFWTDLTVQGEKWGLEGNRREPRWRLVDKSHSDNTALIIMGPGDYPRSADEWKPAETYRAFKLSDGTAVGLLCEAATLEECKAVALALYRMEGS